jgi:hypothetical protein
MRALASEVSLVPAPRAYERLRGGKCPIRTALADTTAFPQFFDLGFIRVNPRKSVAKNLPSVGRSFQRGRPTA